MGHETVERVYCCDRDNDALAVALANRNNDNDIWPAMMMNGMGNQWNNPFVYLVWMMMANRMGWGNDWNAGQNSQIEAMRTQMQDNQNSSMIMDAIGGINVDLRALANQLGCDFNTLSASICDVRNGISKLSGEIGFSAERVINAVTLGNCNIIQQLKDCCCATQKEILTQSNLLQRGQDFINRSIERGFASVEYNTKGQTCELINNQNANTQRIVDLLNGHWKDEQANQIQDLKFQLSQERQNRLLLSRLGGNDCGNGCGNCGGCGY